MGRIMKNKIFKSLKIFAALSVCFLFASFSPSLDGRAVVVDEGVFPQGLFAKTVGYLPGDIISVASISNDSSVDLLVIGALDPSDGVAIMLSPEAAAAIGIDKNANNIVKITKRSGQDERVYGSAVIAKNNSISEFTKEEAAEFDSTIASEAEEDFEDIQNRNAAYTVEEPEEEFTEEPPVEETFVEEPAVEPSEEIIEQPAEQKNVEPAVEEEVIEEEIAEEEYSEEPVEEEPVEEETVEEETEESPETEEFEEEFTEEPAVEDDEELEEYETIRAVEPEEEPEVEAPVEETVEETEPEEETVEEETVEEEIEEETVEEEAVAEEEPEALTEPEEEIADECIEEEPLEDLPATEPVEEPLVEEETPEDYVDEIPEDEEDELDAVIASEIEDLEEPEETDEYEAIVLVPADENPPEEVEEVEEVEDVEEELESLDTEINDEEINKSVVDIEKISNLSSGSKTSNTAPKNIPGSYKKYVVNSLKDLKSGAYYIQIAALSDDNLILEIIAKYGNNYPITIVPMAGGVRKQIMIGPLNMDEYGVVLERFKSYGYKDAFLRKIH